MSLSAEDLRHLRRCVELAREALEDGDEPFGSVLVDADGAVRFEDRNRVKDGDGTIRRIDSACKVWSAGVQASPLGRDLASQSEVEAAPVASGTRAVAAAATRVSFIECNLRSRACRAPS